MLITAVKHVLLIHTLRLCSEPSNYYILKNKELNNVALAVILCMLRVQLHNIQLHFSVTA